MHRQRGAIAQRHHGDHGADANDDAQDGQEGAHQVAPDRAQRQQEGVEQHQATSAVRWSAASMPQRRGVFVGDVTLHHTIHKTHDAFGIGRHVGLMRDHQHGDAVVHVQAPQQLHDLAAALGVQVAGGLVGQQHGGLGDDGAGNGHALLLPARQFGRCVVFPARQADRCQRLAGGRAACAGRFAAVQQGQLHVLLRRGARQQVEALKHKAQIAAAQTRALVAPQGFHMHALEQVFAGGGGVQAAQRVHGGGLARAAGAHDGDKVTGLNVQVHAFEGLQRGGALAIGVGDAAQGYQRGELRSWCFAAALVGDHLHARLQVAAGDFGHAAIGDTGLQWPPPRGRHRATPRPVCWGCCRPPFWYADHCVACAASGCPRCHRHWALHPLRYRLHRPQRG